MNFSQLAFCIFAQIFIVWGISIPKEPEKSAFGLGQIAHFIVSQTLSSLNCCILQFDVYT